MKLRALEISEVNSYIKRVLTNDAILYNLKVKGEISNFKVHSSGNVYLSLKDEKSKINCVIFKSNYNKDLQVDNGSKVIAHGYISLYERDGSYQLYINDIEIEGLGDLYIEFNKLKEQLSKEGLFDVKYKKTIPKIPKSIGVITSETGAVIRDIINVIKRRYPKVNIKLYPVKVQGQQSKYDICEGIKFFNKEKNVDTIIVGRGGGSIEELWSFNEEMVAREVFNSKIPIISAVGHETDVTIADYVSDLRAPTPSAAAELAVWDYRIFENRISEYRFKIERQMAQRISYKRMQLLNYQTKLKYMHPGNKIREQRQRYVDMYDRMCMLMEQKILKSRHRLAICIERMNGLSPLGKLNQGYSYVEAETGQGKQVVKSITQVKKDDQLSVYVTDGMIRVTVDDAKEVTYGENKINR